MKTLALAVAGVLIAGTAALEPRSSAASRFTSATDFNAKAQCRYSPCE
jgi:hypothetical protein